MARGKVDNRLTGKGGVGLVVFHCARLGMEAGETTGGSKQGDLWVRKSSGEVKEYRYGV